MMDTTVQPGDVLWVAVTGECWPSPGHLCMLPGSPASDLQLSGGFGPLGDDEHFMPSPGHQSARDAASIS